MTPFNLLAHKTQVLLLTLRSQSSIESNVLFPKLPHLCQRISQYASTIRHSPLPIKLSYYYRSTEIPIAHTSWFNYLKFPTVTLHHHNKLDSIFGQYFGGKFMRSNKSQSSP